MKKIFTFLIGILFSVMIINSQVAPPQAFSFKATIQGSNGQTVVDKIIRLRISILQDDMNGFPVYSEFFTPTTDHYSQVNLEIGRGNVLSGIFSSIDWSAHKYFLKIEVDAKGGTSYQLLSSTQLLSVPYALYAGSTGNALNIDYNTLLNKPAIPSKLSQLNNDVGYLSTEVDGSVTNEIQTLSIEGNLISLSKGGGSITLPSTSTSGGQYYYLDRDGDNFGDNYYPVWVPLGVTPPEKFVIIKGDCNDNNPAIHPGTSEICGDGIDQDCNGSDLQCNPDIDSDGDGYTVAQGDCNDNDPNIHPGAAEICGDTKDNDCDGEIDEGCVDPNANWVPGEQWLDPVNNVYYKTVIVNNQVWLAENLKSSLYSDGTGIEDITPYVDIFQIDGNAMGFLYSRIAVIKNNFEGSQSENFQGVCPTGWHLPTINDITAISNNFETADLKCSVPNFWNADYDNGTNNSGLNIYPTGYYSSGQIWAKGDATGIWCSLIDYSSGRYLFIDRNTDCVANSPSAATLRSVRCIKN